MYERMQGLFDDAKIEKLNSAHILLVGVGGVGTFCLEGLVRCGIKNITIIDYDTFEESNLNRQLYANRETIGLKKIDVAKKWVENIAKDVNILALDKKLDSKSPLDLENIDIIIDACDSVDAKMNLINMARSYNKKIISCLGVGNRLDPSLITIGNLSEVTSDPLGKKLKFTLRKNNIDANPKVVYSKEVPIKKTPVSSYIAVSATAGLRLCDFVVKEICGYGNKGN